VKAGFLWTTGNSQTTNGAFALAVSRREAANRFTLDAGLAYGKSNVLVAHVNPDTTTDPMMNMIDRLDRTTITTTNNWLTKARYDRFFTANNSGYASGLAAADKVAGKAFVGGGQVGYSRQLLKDAVQTIVSEIGYDFSYESYVQQPMRTLDAVSIHSARLFVGETMKLSSASAANASVEALLNLNTEGSALNVHTGMPGVSPFHDTRMVGKVGLTTTVLSRLSIAFGFTLRYDQNPAPRPIPSGTAPGLVYASGFQPFSDSIDTLAEATLIYAFI
jgi:hypothetical protein